MSMATVGSSLQGNDCTFEQRQADIALAEKREAEAREREKHSPYEVFGQINLDPECGKARRAIIKTSPIAAQVWDFLVEKADKYNAVVCSSKVLEEALGYCRASISKAVRVLKDTGFIDIKKSSTTNVYLLNKQLVWKSWGKNYKYAEFDAKVIISENEQEKPTKSRRMNVVEINE